MDKNIKTITLKTTGRYGVGQRTVKMSVPDLEINHIGYHRYHKQQLVLLDFELCDYKFEKSNKEYVNDMAINCLANVKSKYYRNGIYKEDGEIRYGVSAMTHCSHEYNHEKKVYTVSQAVTPIKAITRPVQVIGCDTGDYQLFVFSDGAMFGDVAKIIASSGNDKLTESNFNDVLEIVKTTVMKAVNHVGNRVVVIESEVGIVSELTSSPTLEECLINYGWDMFAKKILELGCSKKSVDEIGGCGFVNYNKLPMLIQAPREHTTNICSKCLTPNKLSKQTKRRNNGELKIKFKKVKCTSCGESNDTDLNASNILQQYGVVILEEISKQTRKIND